MQFDWNISWLSNNMKVKINFSRICYCKELAVLCLVSDLYTGILCIILFLKLIFKKYILQMIFLF